MAPLVASIDRPYPRRGVFTYVTGPSTFIETQHSDNPSDTGGRLRRSTEGRYEEGAARRPATTKGHQMSDGKTDDAKGRVKEAAGSLTGDDELKREGKRDQAAGTVKEKASDAVDKVRDLGKDKR